MARGERDGRSVAATGVVVALFLVVAALLAGQALGQPVGLSYVETDSMEPTLDEGDGFVAVPPQFTEIGEGDVIVYESERTGEFVTHRVVEVTDQGYVTKGDANPVTDQDGEEPPVTDGRVTAVTLQVNGEVLAIPHLGTVSGVADRAVGDLQRAVATTLGVPAALRVDWLPVLLFGVGVAALLGGLLDGGLLGDGRPSRERSRSRSRPGMYDAGQVTLAVAVLVAATAGGSMIIAGGTHEFGLVSAEFESDAPHVVPVGETETRTVESHNGGLVPTHVVVEPTGPGTNVEPAGPGTETDPGYRYLGPRDSSTVAVAVSAPYETGHYVRSVTEHRYVAIFPRSLVLALHSIHPWLALAATAGALGGIAALPIRVLFGTGTIRTRTRERRRSISGERDP